MKRLLIILSIVLLAACGDVKLDASSQETLASSSAEMAKSLSEEDKQKFAKGLMRASMQSIMQAQGDDKKGMELIKSKIGGKTAKEIIKEYGEN